MVRQMRYFGADYKRMTGKYWFRGLYLWFNPTVIGIFLYRFERGMFLTFGKAWTVVRVLLLPILWLMQSLSHLDINYHAEIGSGLCVLHSCMGVVVNGSAIIGNNVTFVGGNVIGGNKHISMGEFVIGDNCLFGANAVVIGPVIIGDNVKVGASACVVKDVESGCTVGGVPARVL